jgi:metal-sulfur cluster biosynthetic enzyme
MTLTSPNCPVAESLPRVEEKSQVNPVKDAEVKLLLIHHGAKT